MGKSIESSFFGSRCSKEERSLCTAALEQTSNVPSHAANCYIIVILTMSVRRRGSIVAKN